MINAFYFTLNALFVLKIFNVSSWLFGHVEKIALLEKYGWFQNPWCHNLVNKTVAIHILPNISRSKGNQTMKFGQLIEYNMRIIFVEKSHAKCVGETIPRPLFTKLKLSVSLDQ